MLRNGNVSTESGQVHVGLSEAVCFGLSRPNRGVLQIGHRHGILWQDCYGGVFADPF